MALRNEDANSDETSMAMGVVRCSMRERTDADLIAMNEVNKILLDAMQTRGQTFVFDAI